MAKKYNRIMHVLLLICLLLAAVASPAHDFWIDASPYTLEQSGEAELTLYEGVSLKGNSLPYIDEWFRRFELLDQEGKRKIDSILGSDPAAKIRLRSAGITWALYQSTDSYVELEAEKFRTYLLHEGMDYAVAQWQQSGLSDAPARELFQRCAKALLWRPGADDSLLEQSLGLPLEIIPLDNPYRLASGQPLRVRLLYQQQPMAGLTVMALNENAPDEPVRQQTDARGEAVLHLDKTGKWLIKGVHIVRINEEQADWKSYWASLTFELDKPTE